jgi:hypothetical protein
LTAVIASNQADGLFNFNDSVVAAKTTAKQWQDQLKLALGEP